ncbi:MAG: DUF1036 domain-containing protein [Bacteroidota bacterium]
MKICLSIILFSIFYSSGLGQLKFFNDGHRPIRIAIGFYDDNCQCWKTAGWYKIESNATKTILNRIEEGRNYYYHATIDGCNAGFSGEQPLYVDQYNAFDIQYADKGNTGNASRNYVTKRFHQISPESDREFTIHLRQHNMTCNGKKDGEWEINYDKDWHETDDERYIAFKRHIVYQDGKPKGWVQDYYKSGELQWEGKLLSENPDIVHGTATWYYQNGLKQQECVYQNGQLLELCQEWDADGGNVNYDISYGTRTVCSTQKFVVNGGFRNFTGLGKSRIVLPVKLPHNTIRWYYEFSAYQNEADINRVAASFELAGELSRAIDASGITANLIGMLSQPPGEAYCDVFVLDSWNAANFENHDRYRYYGDCSRQNYTSGVVEVNGAHSGTLYLGFRNPATSYPISIAVQVVAVVANYEKRN